MHALRRTALFAMFAFGFLTCAKASAPVTADAMFDQAKTEARAEHKNVLMVFSASWCGPCKLFERYLEDPQMKSIVEKAFIVQRIDVGELANDTKHADTPGGAILRSALGSDPEPGFPWIVITGPDGHPLINSYDHGRKSKNIGYPAEPSEIDWYLNMLRKTAPQLSAHDLAATRAWLQART